MELVDKSSELANKAIKHLSNPKTATVKDITKAVLNACTESSDLIPQNTINKAVARIRAAQSRANQAA